MNAGKLVGSVPRRFNSSDEVRINTPVKPPFILFEWDGSHIMLYFMWDECKFMTIIPDGFSQVTVLDDPTYCN